MNLLDKIAYDTGGYTVQEILSSFCKKILEIIDLVNKNEEVCDEAKTIIENIRNEVVPDLVDDIMKEMEDSGYFDSLVNVTLINQLRTELTRLLNQTITDYTNRLDNFDSQLDTKANEVEVVKKGQVDLDEMTERTLQAIQGGTESSFNLLSIPRDSSVNKQKLDSNIFLDNFIKISNMTMSDNHIRMVALFDCENLQGTNNIDFYLHSDDADINIAQIVIYESDNATFNTSDGTQLTYVNPSTNTGRIQTSINITKRYVKAFISFTTYFEQKTEINFNGFWFKISNVFPEILQIGQWADMAVNTFNVIALNGDNGNTLVSSEKLRNTKTELVNYINNIKNDIIVSNTTVLEVGNGKQFTNLSTAIKSIATSESNNKASKNNPYVVYIYDGEYELYDDLDLDNIQDQTLYKRGLEIPDYVSLIGIGNVTIKCTLPTSEINHAERVQAISTINTYGENYFYNITFIAKNCRYCVHDDGGGEYKNRIIEFVNCTFKHLGNDIGEWTPISQECYGSGYTGGRKGVFKNCIFESEKGIPFYCHTSSQWYMTNPFTLEIDNCAFISKCGISIRLNGVYGADKKNRCTINNSYINQNIEIDDLKNEIILFGGGNSTVTITNNQTTPQVYLVNN